MNPTPCAWTRKLVNRFSGHITYTHGFIPTYLRPSDICLIPRLHSPYSRDKDTSKFWGKPNAKEILYVSPMKNIYSKELQKLFKHIGHICVTPFSKRGVEEWKLLCNSSSKSKKTEHDFLQFCVKVFPMEALERVSTCYTNVTSQLGDVCVKYVETEVRRLPLLHEKLGFSFLYSPLPTHAHKIEKASLQIRRKSSQKRYFSLQKALCAKWWKSRSAKNRESLPLLIHGEHITQMCP